MTMDRAELKARRAGVGLSQILFARTVGVSQNTVSQWETGKRKLASWIPDRLDELEAQRDSMAETYIEFAEAAPGAALLIHETDASFWAAHPDSDGLPVEVQWSAAALARLELADEGDVREILSIQTT